MAFHNPANLQSIANASKEIWPSISGVFSSPWATVRHQASSRGLSRNAVAANTPKKSVAEESSDKAKNITGFPLPDILDSLPMSTFRFRPATRAIQEIREANELHGARSSISSLSPRTLRLANPMSPKLYTMPSSARSYSTLLRPMTSRFMTNRNGTLMEKVPRRSLFGSNSSRNLLAHMEQTANNNPQSATAQNGFYQALLRANMPEIVVERYQTGRFATNAACEATYLRALEKLGQSEKTGAILGQSAVQGQDGTLGADQLRAIGQAVAAQSRGSNIGLTRSGSAANGTGAKESPLYVVVDETIGGTVFKWVKFLLYFGLVGYLSLVFITLTIEATGVFRRVGATQNNEAKPEHQTTRFDDVHGCDEAKEELQELVEFLKNPERFSTLGGKLPKGVLLVGPPGTGKTLLARAVAGEAGVPFFFMSGSEFDEVYVGVGAKRVRDLFNSARTKAPAIIFIDELDAIGGKRNERDAAYAKQTLNQLLTELDGFSQDTGVIIIAATNFPQLLDKALTRPGRFDRNVVVPLPDVRGRVAILNHHMKNVQTGPDVDSTALARQTIGFSGADLENVVNQAAVRASRNKSPKVSMVDFEWAKDKIMMGAERRSAVIQQKDKIMTAYHEGGHALVAMYTEAANPLYKATIMPRGMALGMTSFMPEMDKVSQAKKELLATIDVAMGGKVAEELVYGHENVTSGASSDLQNATRVAYAMVTQYGMSDELGSVDLDYNYARLSPDTKRSIENEVRRLIEDGHSRAMHILVSRRKELDLLANALVEYETLDKGEIEKVVRGEKLPDKIKSLPGIAIKLPEVLLPPRFEEESPKNVGSGSSRKPGESVA